MRTCVFVAVAAVACRPAQARPESQATMTGTATFVGGPPESDRGSIRLTVTVLGEINDECDRSGLGQAVGTYVGELVLGNDGTFTANLYPLGLYTLDGCAVDDIRVQRVITKGLVANVAGRVGWGALQFQDLSAVDQTELRAGAFGTLYADLMFEPPVPPPR